MQNHSNSHNKPHNVSLQVDDLFQKGQVVSYEGKRAYVLNTKPMLVIKTKDRVICGALHRYLSIGGHRLNGHDQ